MLYPAGRYWRQAVRMVSRRVAWSAAAAIMALAAGGCSIPSALPASRAPAVSRGTVATSGKVISLTSISTLKALFNRADGHARLVLIFSPT
jgi:hypothetical protein